MFPIPTRSVLPAYVHVIDVAKSDDASLGTRATAAKDAVGDKLDEKKHEV